LKAAVRKILIVKLSSLGDVVHAMPAVQDMRRTLKNVQIDWVVERAFAPLVARCEGVHRVIACDLRRWSRAPLSAQTRQQWSAFRADLRGESYDAVIDLQGLTKSALVSWIARTTPSGRRFGLANQTEGSGFEAPARWVADVAIDVEPRIHAVQRSRVLCAAALGYAVEGPDRFGLKPGALAVAPAPPKRAGNSFAPRKPWVALVHGTSRADKEWPLDAWVALGKRLNYSGFGVALAHGSAPELVTSEAIAAQLQDAWLWPIMGLDALTDTMALCAGVVGVDSGLSHIAVALGLPHVQMYNFDTAWRTGPQPGLLYPRANAPSARQVAVFAAPHPDLEAVWSAWESLSTPALCR